MILSSSAGFVLASQIKRMTVLPGIAYARHANLQVVAARPFLKRRHLGRRRSFVNRTVALIRSLKFLRTFLTTLKRSSSDVLHAIEAGTLIIFRALEAEQLEQISSPSV
jgi:hypothetical protein